MLGLQALLWFAAIVLRPVSLVAAARLVVGLALPMSGGKEEGGA